MLYISGQVKRETTIASCPHIPLRQLGDQEINIIDIVRPITKFAEQIANPKDTRRLLENAIHLATSGRPGPVWLDVPLDIQGAMVNEGEMLAFDPDEQEAFNDILRISVSETIQKIKESKRPAIIAGHGVRIAGATDVFRNIAQRLCIPILSTFNGFDLIETNNPLFAGRIGTLGNRAGNFVLQNCDLLLSLGSRNNIRQIGFDWNSYARRAYKIMVDIDKAELDKPTIRPDMAINCDVGAFPARALKKASAGACFPDWSEAQVVYEKEIEVPGSYT